MNLSENRILSETETEQLYLKSLSGQISIIGIHGSIKAQLLDYAKKKLDSLNRIIFELMELNPNTNFDYWKVRNRDYADAMVMIKWLEQPEPLPTQQTETEQGTPIFTNNFDNIKPTEIYKHFKAGLVEKGYLTEQELNEYLKAAFELKTIPETLFKIKDAPKKPAIEAVFYKYYKNVAGKIHGKQTQYAALLGDYFEGYKTTTVSSNFSKSVY